MAMNNRDARLIDRFVERVKELDRVESAVLFGSIARGDEDRRSDIDIMVIVDHRRPMSLLSKVTAIITDLKPHRDIQCTLTNLRDRDEQFYRNVFREGKVLFGKMVLTPDRLLLKPYTMITYDLTGVAPSKKVRVANIIHGHRSTKKAKGRTYRYKYEGLKDRRDARVLGRGVILLSPESAEGLAIELKRLRIKYQSTEIWMPPWKRA